MIDDPIGLSIVQKQLDPPPDKVAIAVRRDDDVGCERTEARGHGPDMQVVHACNAGAGFQEAAHGGGVDAGRHRVHRKLCRLA